MYSPPGTVSLLTASKTAINCNPTSVRTHPSGARRRMSCDKCAAKVLLYPPLRDAFWLEVYQNTRKSGNTAGAICNPTPEKALAVHPPDPDPDAIHPSHHDQPSTHDPTAVLGSLAITLPYMRRYGQTALGTADVTQMRSLRPLLERCNRLAVAPIVWREFRPLCPWHDHRLDCNMKCISFLSRQMRQRAHMHLLWVLCCHGRRHTGHEQALGAVDATKK